MLLQKIEDRHIGPSVIDEEREVITDGAVEGEPVLLDQAEHRGSCDKFGDGCHALRFEW